MSYKCQCHTYKKAMEMYVPGKRRLKRPDKYAQFLTWTEGGINLKGHFLVSFYNLEI